MLAQMSSWDYFRPLTWDHVLMVLAIGVFAGLLSGVVRRVFRRLAERVAPRFRLSILRVSPIIRLSIGLAAILLTIPILVEPTLQNVIALLAAGGIAIALAFKELSALTTYPPVFLRTFPPPAPHCSVTG